MMNGNTLVIMAAGLGSRYGGIKQLESVGPNGEIIMDYSIYDAMKAGFKKVVFVIREDIKKDFIEVIGKRISQIIEVEYVIQDINNIPEGFELPKGRTKPWGTGHAVLSCLNKIREPFAVINADDYYGREAFIKVNQFLSENQRNTQSIENGQGEVDYKYQFCMAGFVLGNTLSENGTVSRGICKVDKNYKLVDVVETTDIIRKGNRAITLMNSKEEVEIDLEASVSMNMWGFTPEMLLELEASFFDFISNLNSSDCKAEFYLPEVVANLIKADKAEVTVLKTNDRWFGITYKEDREYVRESFVKLTKEGMYPDKLY
jgi:dTDP-glucose pyrophosphorylase